MRAQKRARATGVVLARKVISGARRFSPDVRHCTPCPNANHLDMSISDWFSLLAVVLSIGNIVFLLWNHRQTRHQEALATNLAALASVDLAIKDNPSVLRFHGVTEDDLSAAGITGEELAYLVATFHTGSIYYSIVGKDTSTRAFTEADTYRYYLCTTESTRRAWPLLKRFLMDSPYKRRLEVTIAKIDEESHNA